jgi:hypothetical protein
LQKTITDSPSCRANTSTIRRRKRLKFDDFRPGLFSRP